MLAVARVVPFRKEGQEEDKHGNTNAYLRCISGVMPYKAVVQAGTIINNEEMELGQSYLLKFTATEVDEEYGQQYRMENFGSLTTLQLLSPDVRSLGEGKVLREGQFINPEDAEEEASKVDEGATK